MSAIAVAIGVAGIGGALIGGNAAQNAANTQSQAATAANQLQYTEWLQQQANMAPYLQSGTQNLAALNAAMPSMTANFTMQDFQQDPGYQFDLNQGTQAMQRSAAAQGMLNSTGTHQDLNNYAQGMASNEYGNAYNRFRQGQQQQYSMLSGMANMGQNAAINQGTLGYNTMNSMGQTLMSGATATSAGQIAQGNMYSNMLNTGANSFGNGMLMSQLASNAMGNTPQNSAMGSYLTGGGNVYGANGNPMGGYQGMNTMATGADPLTSVLS